MACAADATAAGACGPGSTSDGVTCACNAGYYGDGVTCTALACGAGEYRDLAEGTCGTCAVCAADAGDVGAACDGTADADTVVCACNAGAADGVVRGSR